MELTRRRFATLLAAAAAAAAGIAACTERLLPARFVKAARPRAFPGRLRPLDESRASRPARWLG
jgi:hypothetical protein